MEGIKSSYGPLCCLTTYCKQIHSLHLQAQVILECLPLHYLISFAFIAHLIPLFMRWLSVFEVKSPVSHHDASLCSGPGNILISLRYGCILPNLTRDDSDTYPVVLNPVYSICSHYIEPSPFLLMHPSKEIIGTGQESCNSVCHQWLMIWWWILATPCLQSNRKSLTT